MNTHTAKVSGSIELLQRSVQEYGKVVYSSSLGAESIVLTDLIWTHAPEIDLVTLDTGRLPEETLALIERLERHYKRRMKIYYPDAADLQSWVQKNGINGFYNSLEQRQGCCVIRKVEPFARAVVGYQAWVTGVRHDQSAARAFNKPIELDARYGLQKISPLLAWTEAEVWDYIRTNKLPYNPLHDRNYPSIGCAPCTRAIEPGEDPRAGRWWWENPESRECGLQPRPKQPDWEV
jgi:phosphoadenosine phosphosulfate reductase